MRAPEPEPCVARGQYSCGVTLHFTRVRPAAPRKGRRWRARPRHSCVRPCAQHREHLLKVTTLPGRLARAAARQGQPNAISLKRQAY